ncbi:MAG: flagellar protein FliT [Gammaproteobacteria bacterium]
MSPVVAKKQIDDTRSGVPSAIPLILELSHKMLESARSGKWEDLISLEQRRADAIAKTFVSDQLNDIDHLEVALLQIIDLDQEILSLSEQHCSALKSELNKINRGRQAIDGYTK